MFRTKENIKSQQAAIEQAQDEAEDNYLIQNNDYIEVRVFTNDGEIIIDPPRISNQTGNGNRNMMNNGGLGGIGMNNQNQNNLGGAAGGNTFPLQFPSFLIKQDGFAKLPKIGEVRLQGLTLAEADSLLETKYVEYYESPFVRTRYSNKRIFVFKGSRGQVFPLRNEKISLLEVLAQTGGVGNDLRASNIRLIRGDLQDPMVSVINLGTIEGLTKQNLTIEPNDIVYVEPIRKSFLEALRDISPILSFVTTTITFVLLFR